MHTRWLWHGVVWNVTIHKSICKDSSARPAKQFLALSALCTQSVSTYVYAFVCVHTVGQYMFACYLQVVFAFFNAVACAHVAYQHPWQNLHGNPFAVASHARGDGTFHFRYMIWAWTQLVRWKMFMIHPFATGQHGAALHMCIYIISYIYIFLFMCIYKHTL